MIAGITSGIGEGLARHFMSKKSEIVGTYRTKPTSTQKFGCDLTHVDFSKPDTLENFCSKLSNMKFFWDVMIICPGTMTPVGKFIETPFDSWEQNIQVNFLGTMRFIHYCLKFRNSEKPSTVILFAGGGTNGVTSNTSAYTLSKIALIKAMELLQHEHPLLKWTIIGPGWVNTKIHEETLSSPYDADVNKKQTEERLKSGNFTEQSAINEFCEWIIEQPTEVVGGRNFSVVHDNWKQAGLIEKLLSDQNMFKLRRHGNS